MRLSDNERARLNGLITAGRHPARQLLKARILLKADVSDAGDGWTDNRIAEAPDTSWRFEWHYTPKHGSWLDMAKCEISVLSRQRLGRRIADKPTLTKKVAAWQQHRNTKHAKADWHFTNADARIKLKRLYPAT